MVAADGRAGGELDESGWFGPERPRNRQKTGTSGVARVLVWHHESTESPGLCKKENAGFGVSLVDREVVKGSRRVPLGERGSRGIREAQRGRKVVGE